MSSGRQDEILRLAREAAGDEATFMQGLLALARRDVQEVLDQIRALDEPGSRTIAYEELAALRAAARGGGGANSGRGGNVSGKCY